MVSKDGMEEVFLWNQVVFARSKIEKLLLKKLAQFPNNQNPKHNSQAILMKIMQIRYSVAPLDEKPKGKLSHAHRTKPAGKSRLEKTNYEN